MAVFGGTTEGRELSQTLARRGAEVTLFVATGYGEELISVTQGLSVIVGRLTAAEMTVRLGELRFDIVVDATHPYAAEATANIVAACAEIDTPYLRLLRGETCLSDVHTAADAAAAAALLDRMPGRVLLTVGSKELERFTAVSGWQERIFARVLPSPQVVESCVALGFGGAHLICMQGPFTQELNAATIRMLDIDIVVTKDSGSTGGMPEKLAAARQTGAEVIVIRRPVQEEGLPPDELMSLLAQRLHLSEPEPAPTPRFPLFVSLERRAVLVAGGGNIAARRVETLLSFGAEVTVVSPELCPALQKRADRIEWRKARYTDVSGFDLAIATTNDREVNRRVREDAQAAGIPASIADCKEESSFWFPAVVRSGNLVAGLVSTDGDHSAVKKKAGIIREILEGNE